MRNQIDYFEKVIRAIKDLKRDHPDVEVSKHYLLATDGSLYPLSDKELYTALQKYRSELDMNTLSDKDMERVISDTKDLFEEIEPDHIFYENYDENDDPVF